MLNNQLCQQYLQRVYQDQHALNDSAKRNSIAETYGEILPQSVTRLISSLSLTERDRFFDLGSGMGKVALQFFLQTQVQESCGIEILPYLHERAASIAQRVATDLPQFYANNRKLNFLSGSFFDIDFTAATVLLIGSPCFGPSILDRLGCMINSSSNIHTVLSLRPVISLQRLLFRKAIKVECSWDSALCYVYAI